jgi:hypothetical protein
MTEASSFKYVQFSFNDLFQEVEYLNVGKLKEMNSWIFFIKFHSTLEHTLKFWSVAIKAASSSSILLG